MHRYIHALSVNVGGNPNRGFVEDQPQRVRRARVLRLALRAQPRSYRQLVDALSITELRLSP